MSDSSPDQPRKNESLNDLFTPFHPKKEETKLPEQKKEQPPTLEIPVPAKMVIEPAVPPPAIKRVEKKPEEKITAPKPAGGNFGLPKKPLFDDAGKPAETKPAEIKSSEPSPVEVKPTETKPVEPKPVEVKPWEVKPTSSQPREIPSKSVTQEPEVPPVRPQPRPVPKMEPRIEPAVIKDSAPQPVKIPPRLKEVRKPASPSRKISLKTILIPGLGLLILFGGFWYVRQKYLKPKPVKPVTGKKIVSPVSKVSVTREKLPVPEKVSTPVKYSPTVKPAVEIPPQVSPEEKLKQKRQYFMTAHKFFSKGQYKEARENFKKVLEFDPQHEESRKYIDRCEEKLGGK